MKYIKDIDSKDSDLKNTVEQKTVNTSHDRVYMDLVNESLKLRRFLQKFDRLYANKEIIIVKDGNRLGKRKHSQYLKALCRVYDIKLEINSSYGAY